MQVKHFLQFNDFLNRVNPKDINKLQLEGLVKAGAFDGIETNSSHYARDRKSVV